MNFKETHTKKALALCLVLLALVLAVAGCASTNKKADENDKKKVALLLSGPANDQGWNAKAIEGLDDIKEEYDLETTFMENLDAANSQAAFYDYASQGYDLIIGHGFQFGEPAANVSKDFPDQYFMAIESNNSTENMSSFVTAQEQGVYLSGALAALVSKTKVVGMVGGMEMPSITKSVEAFKLGAKYIDPEITVLTSYADTFTDVTAGTAAATAMINQNADVLCHAANQAGIGVIKACEEHNIYCIGGSHDQSSIAPSAVIASSTYSIPKVIVFAYEQVLNNEFGGEFTSLGIKEGVVDFVFSEGMKDIVGADNISRINEIKGEIASGERVVPIIEIPTK